MSGEMSSDVDVEEEVNTTGEDILNMSDEDFDKMQDAPPVIPEGDPVEEEVDEPEEKNEEVEEESAEVSETKEKADEASEEGAVPVTEEEAPDYEKMYKELASPFKANGKDMTVDKVEDIRQLMQMGANYNKKMAGLKPNLKLLKMLENNGLLDSDKLEYLIDLDKKTPGAVNKLVKDSGIDPLDIDVDSSEDYVPNKYNVTDSQIELDDVIDSIRDSPSFQDTIDTVTNEWDDSSKKVVLEQPSILKLINDHKTNGIYEQISTVVSSEKVMGRLSGLSDIEAYKQVGDAIQKNGGFDHLFTKKEEVPVKPKVASPEEKKRKQSAKTTKSTNKVTKQRTDYNPLALSDEEFDKVFNNKYL